MNHTLTSAEVESLRMSLQGRFGEATATLADGHQGTLVDLRRLLTGVESALTICAKAAAGANGQGTPSLDRVEEVILLGIGGKRTEWAQFVAGLSTEEAGQVRNALASYGSVVSAAAVKFASRT